MNQGEEFRATGYRVRGEGGEGGGATWENQVELILVGDQLRLVETQVVDPPRVTESEVAVADLGDARLGPDALVLRVKRKKWWKHLVGWLEDPPKIRFRPEEAEAVRELTAELVRRLSM
jgi:hypothetical protein